jgi:probable HAF family extracellular repeat protein
MLQKGNDSRDRLLLTCLVVAALCGRAEAEPPRYTLQPVQGLAAATGINNQGDIVGWLAVGSASAPVYHAALWQRSTEKTSDLGTLGGTKSAGYGINDCADVVGQASLPGDSVQHAFIYQQGKIQDLDPKGAGSIARSINNKGAAVGSFTVAGTLHPALFDQGTVKDLTGGPGDANSISLEGDVAGTSIPGEGEADAFVIQNGMLTNINPGTITSSYAYGINDYADVVGVAPFMAAFYQPGYGYHDGKTTDLGNFGGNITFARAVNNSDQIVGYANLASNPNVDHAFFYRSGTLSDLNDLIDPSDPLATFVTLQDATGINDSGWIVATGVDSRSPGEQIYLLTPKAPAIELKRVAGGCPAT